MGQRRGPVHIKPEDDDGDLTTVKIPQKAHSFDPPIKTSRKQIIPSCAKSTATLRHDFTRDLCEEPDFFMNVQGF